MMQFRCADGVEPEYLCGFLNSPLGFGQASADVGGSASPHVNIKAIRRFMLPLPPSAEQRRIVARVRELMDQCDQLEARLGVRDRIGALLAGSMASAIAS
jgi:type I restriction enzyme S subunit